MADTLDATVVDMRFVKPLDTAMIDDICATHDAIITLEENTILGGAGSAVNEYLVANDWTQKVKVRNVGLPDVYLEHGDKQALLASVGISVDGLLETCQNLVSH